MSAPLTSDELKRYTALIDEILSTADLLTVTRKKVRKGLERALDGKDLSDQKEAIKALIEVRFDAINSQAEATGNMPTPPPPTPKRDHSTMSGSNNGYDGYYGGGGDDSASEIKVSVERSASANGGAGHQAKNDSPPAKKSKHQAAQNRRASSALEDADARLAAELQAQENRLARGRTTRGAGAGRSAKPVKPRKKKSAAKVKGSADDSDAEVSDGSGGVVVKEKRKAGGGFQKPFNLSDQLSQLVGEQQLSRPQVVKKLWEHIKGNSLQDPSDKRQILCDEKLQAVFKQSKVDMFQMNKLLGNHLYPLDEE